MVSTITGRVLALYPITGLKITSMALLFPNSQVVRNGLNSIMINDSNQVEGNGMNGIVIESNTNASINDNLIKDNKDRGILILLSGSIIIILM